MINPKVKSFSFETPRLRPRIGFVGADWLGLSRIETIINSGLAEVAAVAEPGYQEREYASMIAPDANMLCSFDAMFDLDLDGVIISASGHHHAVKALEKGLAVFSCKPFAATLDETLEVVETARTANRLLGVDFSYRHTTGMKAVREAVSKGELGNVYAVNLTFHNAFEPNQWFHQGKTSRGIPVSEGCVIDLGSSMIDLALWTLDYPRIAHVNSRLYANGKPVQSGEDYATAQIVLEDDTVVQLACSWNLPMGCDAMIRAEFYGTRGGMSFHNIDGSLQNFVADRFYGARRETLLTPHENWDGRAMMEWLHRLSVGQRYHPDAERYVDIAEALEAIYQNTL